MKSEIDSSLEEIINQIGATKRKIVNSDRPNVAEMSLDQIIKMRGLDDEKRHEARDRDRFPLARSFQRRPYERRDRPPPPPVDYRAMERMVRQMVQEELNQWNFFPRRQWNRNQNRQNRGPDRRTREPDCRAREAESFLCSPFAAVDLKNLSTTQFESRRPIAYETPVKRQRRF